MGQLNFQASLKSVDAERGEFTGIAAAYGNTDRVGDRIQRGAFTKTIAERPVVKLLYQHDTDQPIGTGTLTDSPAGLIIRGKLALGVERARDTYELLKAGVLDALSIGYEVVSSQKAANGVRLLTEIRVWEVSVVTFPANECATIEDVKEASDDEVALLRQLAGVARGSARDIEARILLAQQHRLIEQVRETTAGLRRA